MRQNTCFLILSIIYCETNKSKGATYMNRLSLLQVNSLLDAALLLPRYYVMH